MTLDLVVVGTVAFDTVATVARLPATNEAALVSAFEDEPGGAAGNVARALGAWGASPALIAVVGDDFLASPYRDALIAAGVDVSHVVAAGPRSAHAFSFSDASGAQHIYFAPGASTRSDALPAPTPAAFGHFAAGDLSAYPAHMAACERVTFDPGQETFHRAIGDVAACLPLADVVLVNEHEAARLREALDVTPRAFVAASERAFVVTRGSAGATVTTAAGVADVPAVPAVAVDPTGAGDAHRAGVVFGLTRGLDIVTAVRVGNVAGACATESFGAQAALPDVATLRARYESAFGAWPL